HLWAAPGLGYLGGESPDHGHVVGVAGFGDLPLGCLADFGAGEVDGAWLAVWGGSVAGEVVRVDGPDVGAVTVLSARCEIAGRLAHVGADLDDGITRWHVGGERIQQVARLDRG